MKANFQKGGLLFSTKSKVVTIMGECPLVDTTFVLDLIWNIVGTLSGPVLQAVVYMLFPTFHFGLHLSTKVFEHYSDFVLFHFELLLTY